MILEVLIGLSAAFAFYWIIRTKKIFPSIISLGMISGILLVIFLPPSQNLPGYYIYMGFVALAFIYGLLVKEKNIWARIIICLMSAAIFVYWLWVMNHWHGNAVLLPFVAIIAGLTALIMKVKLKNELGFLTILFVDAIAVIIENCMKSI